MNNKYFDMAQIFKALGDENRLRIVEMLQKGERCAANILTDLNITQPTLSHHMKVLCDMGIVECRKSGKWMYYRISESGCRVVLKWIDKVIKEGIAAPKASVEKPVIKKAKKTVKPRTASEKKVSEKKAEEIEREQRRSREVDIVIL